MTSDLLLFCWGKFVSDLMLPKLPEYDSRHSRKFSVTSNLRSTPDYVSLRPPGPSVANSLLKSPKNDPTDTSIRSDP